MTEAPVLPPSPVARRLHLAVREQPGIHFRALQRAAQVSSAGQLRHHLDRLHHLGLVVEVPDGGFTRYFPPSFLPTDDASQTPFQPDAQPGTQGTGYWAPATSGRPHGAPPMAFHGDRRDRAARLSRPLARAIAKQLLAGPATRTQLRREARCADSTLGYQLRRLLACGDLARTEDGRYQLADAEGVRQWLRPLGGAPLHAAPLDAAPLHASPLHASPLPVTGAGHSDGPTGAAATFRVAAAPPTAPDAQAQPVLADAAAALQAPAEASPSPAAAAPTPPLAAASADATTASSQGA